MSKIYNFDRDLKKEQQLTDRHHAKIVRLLRRYFKTDNIVRVEDKHTQLVGADYIVDDYYVDIKYDKRAKDTGNLAIEVESNGKASWGVRESNKQTHYFLFITSFAPLLISSETLYNFTDYTINAYQEYYITNVGYDSKIHAVPIHVMREIAKEQL